MCIYIYIYISYCNSGFHSHCIDLHQPIVITVHNQVRSWHKIKHKVSSSLLFCSFDLFPHVFVFKVSSLNSLFCLTNSDISKFRLFVYTQFSEEPNTEKPLSKLDITMPLILSDLLPSPPTTFSLHASRLPLISSSISSGSISSSISMKFDDFTFRPTNPLAVVDGGDGGGFLGGGFFSMKSLRWWWVFLASGGGGVFEFLWVRLMWLRKWDLWRRRWLWRVERLKSGCH